MAFYTDLACEKCTDKLAKLNDKLKYGCEEIVVNINSLKKQEKYGLYKGNYYFLGCPNLNLLAPIVSDYIVEQVANYLKLELKKKLKKQTGKVMVVGLGNEYLTCDSLGVKVTKGIVVTPSGVNGNSLCAFCPGVLGQTGIETSSLVKSVVQLTKPDVVIVVDALCALSTSRLGSSIQINDAGIVPGGAVGNNGQILNSKYLGVPTLSIGVPLVVRTETIISDVLSELSDNMVDFDQSLLKNIRNFIVTPKNIDSLVKLNAEIISSAINLSVLDLKIDEQKAILR